jgi:hypothetical protein
MERKSRSRGITTLVALPGVRARKGLRLVLDGQNAIAEREFSRKGNLHQGVRALIGDDLEMIGLAANDATERHRAVEWVLRGRRMIERDRQGERDFERAGHTGEFEGGSRLGKGGFRALQEKRVPLASRTGGDQRGEAMMFTRNAGDARARPASRNKRNFPPQVRDRRLAGIAASQSRTLKRYSGRLRLAFCAAGRLIAADITRGRPHAEAR